MTLGVETANKACLSLLQPDGTLVHPEDIDSPALAGFDLKNLDVPDMYRAMLFARRFDEQAVTLQRQGRLGTYPPLHGQEAAQVGSAKALKRSDWILPTYRDHGATMTHGVPPQNTLLYWAGYETGNEIPDDVRVFPISVPVATQIPHAVGMAWAAKIKGESSVTLTYFGDGATSKGDFHEALNFAGLFKLPVIFFCQNNGYAISVPLARQTAAGSLAQRAAGYGFEGLQVDGNDALAVYAVTSYAARKARSGQGPTLIEAITYRVGPHTTVDDPNRYRNEGEVETWRRQDPIIRLRRYLESHGDWDEAKERETDAEIRRQLEVAVEKMERQRISQPDDVFAHVYAEMSAALASQKRSFLGRLNSDENGRDPGRQSGDEGP